MLRARKDNQPANRSGMTILELMIVVCIIGVLAAIATATFVHAHQAVQDSRFTSDLRVMSTAYVQYYFEHNCYPPTAAPGVIPSGMENYLKRTGWTNDTPIGGRWQWITDAPCFSNGVAVSGHGVSLKHLTGIDGKLDDGDLATGKFQSLGGGASCIYAVE